MNNFKNLFKTRFAPSPSGYMHIGNIRSALFSYLCAKENDGFLILRIEDTDITRTSEVFLNSIYFYLNWLSLNPDEGPQQGGSSAPYIQSERSNIYKVYLEKFITLGFAYRCFKTVEELNEIREKQKLLGLPPRYERNSCLMNEEKEKELLNNNIPFVWRFKLPSGFTNVIDKVRNKIEYDLSNFADFPLTRQDATFTFLFANFVDDVEMNIQYVVRGEEHTSNTALQSAMYDILKIEKPIFYHLPLICDINGKKLSKRDFGFSLQDLINENYLPEAIINYLILIGSSFEQEIFSLEEAINLKLFSKTKSTGAICYDIKKLQWINKQWIKRISLNDFMNRISRIEENLSEDMNLIESIKNESNSLNDAIKYLNYFSNNYLLEIKYNDEFCKEDYKIIFANEFLKLITKLNNENKNKEELFLSIKEFIKSFSKSNNIEEKKLMKLIRYILTLNEEGLGISVLLKYLSNDEIIIRINKFIEFYSK